MLVSFEGLDGSGKSTIANIINDRINYVNKEYKSFLFSFPNYESLTGNLIKELLQGKYGKDIDPKIFANLMIIDRLALKEEINKLNRNPYNIILIDRYFHSNVALQIPKLLRNEPNKSFEDTCLDFYNYLYLLEFNSFGKVSVPDMVIYLSGDIKTCKANVKKRGAEDIHEEENFEFSLQVQKAYDWMRNWESGLLLYDRAQSIYDSEIHKNYVENIITIEDTRWKKIQVTEENIDGHKMKSLEKIADEVYISIQRFL